MKSVVISLVMFTGCFFLSGCATIFNHPSQEVAFVSNPMGAKVIVDGKEYGNTPTTVRLKRGKSHQVVFELDGYELSGSVLRRRMSGWFWGNIVFGGLIGMGVDAITGSMFKLYPEEINVTLTKKEDEPKIETAK